MIDSLPDRIQRKIWPEPMSGCWLWGGSLNKKNGYGVSSVGGRHVRVHRLVFEHCNGRIPDGLCVCHRCDNPACCNPDHLFLGRHLDNMADMKKKGRRAPMPEPDTAGEKSGRACLTDQQVLSIAGRIVRGESTRAIAKEHGVPTQVITGIRSGKTWVSVTGGDLRPRIQRRDGSKLCTESVLEILEAVRSGESQQSVADRFRVDRSLVGQIVAGRAWKHVPRRKAA